MTTDKLEQAIAAGDRHEIRQTLIDIFDSENGMQTFVDWVNSSPEELVKAVADELVIIEGADGEQYITLRSDGGLN